MAILSNVLALDLGSHSFKAVELRQSLRGFEAVALRILPASPEDPELSEHVQHFVRMHRLSTDHVVTALPGDRVSTRRFSFPFRDRKKLTAAVPFEVEEDSLFDLEDVVVDWEIVGGDRHHSEVAAAIARRDEVASLLEALERAGCPPRTVEAEGMLLGNLSAVFDLSGTRLLVDLGHRKTTCCLVSDGHPLAARTFPVAGAALTEALARDRGLGLEAAEIAKCESGVFGGGTTAAPPQAEATLSRIAREIVRTCGSLEEVIAKLDSGPLAQVTLIGGTAQLGGIDQFLTERVGVPTERLGLPIEGPGNGFVAGGSPILFAPAIAMAIRGTAQAKTRTNLRQQEFAVRLDLNRFRRDLLWPSALAGVAILLAIVNIATSTLLESGRARQVEAQVSQLFAEVFPGRPVPDNALAALREEVRSAGDRAEFLGVYRGNLSALDLLTEISTRVPQDLDVVFEELSIDKQVIRMRVYATSFEAADRLGAELAKFAPFSRARIGSIETDKKRGGKRFNVTISLAEGASSA